MGMDMVTATVTVRKSNFSRFFLSNLSSFQSLAVALGYLALAAPSAVAGDWTITPTMTVTETSTDNVALSQTNKQSDLITDLNPGIRIEGTGGRSKLKFDYQLHKLYYAQNSTNTETQNSLNALGSLEALEDWFFIDASAMISQQTLSPFLGTTSSSVNTNATTNSTETSTYRLSPYFRGTLGGAAEYQLRYNVATTTTKSNQDFDSDSRELVLALKGVTRLSSLGWSLDASTQKVEYGNNLDNNADILRGRLTYQISPQFLVSVIGGVEANDYLTADKESESIKGAGFEWSPTERTKLSVTRENRYFGNANAIDFTHRTAGTAWKYKESKDVTATPNEQSALGVGTNYDLLFSQYSSAIPDPVARAAYVNALLLSAGISPNAQMQGGYLTSGVQLQHRREFSFAVTGVRNTVTFAANQSETSSPTGATVLVGNNLEAFQKIEQRAASVNWSHKLTPLSTLVAMVSRLESTGSGTTALDTTQRNYTLNFLTKLAPNTSAGLGARRVIMDGTTSYTENAFTGTLSHQF